MKTFAFNTRQEVEAWLAKPKASGTGNSSREGEVRKSWDLKLGYQGAERMFTEGWKEGAERVERAAQDLLVGMPLAARIGFQHAVAGAFPDVPAYLAGEAEAMLEPIMVERPGPKMFTLYVPIVYAYWVKAEAMNNRGVAIAAIVDALENMGVRCRVFAYVTNGTQSNHLYLVKDHQDHLNLEDLSFIVTHPGFFRRLHFAIMERHTDSYEKQCTLGGYGSATHTLTTKELPEADQGEAHTIMRQLNVQDVPTTKDFLRTLVAELPAELQTMLKEQE